MSDLDLMLRFMLQILVVLIACKVIGWIGTKFLKQAQVTMEMIVGVLLGPSLLLQVAPKLQQYLFPQFLHAGVPTSGKHPSMSILYVIAQVGLVLYMFLIGLEFDLKLISSRAKGAIATSVAGILFPFALGAGLILFVFHSRTDLFMPGITVGNQALYLGAAMSITAFPMLARIIYEAGISGTSLGTLALGAGATDDAAAWSLLAVVLATAKGDPNIAIFAIGGGILFVGSMLTIGRMLLAPLGEIVEREGGMSQTLFSSVLIFLFAGAWFTDAIGIYAVFGAFVIGASMPRGKFATIIRERLEGVTVGLFLPFFFVYSGLNTSIGSLSSPGLWAIAGLILVCAIAGKFGGCYAAARLSGESHKEALAIGTLMNSRGLMELIILNIAKQNGVITVQLFTIMVLMAIVTTVMTAPIFELVYGKTLASLKGAFAPANA